MAFAGSSQASSKTAASGESASGFLSQSTNLDREIARPEMVMTGLTISVLVTSCVLWRLCPRLWCDSLASAKPAHWSGRYTGTWIWWQHVRDPSAIAVHQAHLRPVSVVRIGPAELSVCCVDGGLRAIYGIRYLMPKTA